MTSNLRRSTRIGSRSSSCSSAPLPVGAATSVKIQAPNGVQTSDEELVKSGVVCVKQEPCEEVFGSGRGDATISAQNSSSTTVKPFPLLAGSPITLSGTVFYECADMLVVTVNWRGRELTGALIREGKGPWAPTRITMLEEADGEAQERSEEPAVRTRKRKGPRSKEKVNTEVKISPARSTGRKRGRASKAKKEEEEEVEEDREEEEGKSKESELGESNGDDDKEIVNATTKQSLQSKSQSTDLANQTATKELTNSQPSPAGSSKPDSPCETPEYFECPAQDCPRKYKHMKSLKHHLACAHQGIRRPSLKRKNMGTSDQNTENDDTKTGDSVQSSPAKKKQSDSPITGTQRQKSGLQRASHIDYASGDSDRGGNETFEDGKNRSLDEVKQVRRTGRRLAARRYHNQKDQSDEDQEDDGHKTPPPPKKEIRHEQPHYLEDDRYKGNAAASLLQASASQTLGFGNNFTVVNGTSSRLMTAESPVKGSLPAALKITNNQIHNGSGAEACEGSSAGQHTHYSSLMPTLNRLASGQITSNNNIAGTDHLPSQVSSAKEDTGDTVGSDQRSEGHLVPSMEDKKSSKAIKKSRSSAADSPDKLPIKTESVSSASGVGFLARLNEAAAFGGRTDNERMKSEQNLNDFHPPTAAPFVPNLDSLLQRNGSYLGRGHTVGSSKDIPSSSSVPSRSLQPSPSFSHPFSFLAGEAFGGFPRFPTHPLAGFHYPIPLGGIPGFANVDFNALAELNKARGGSA